MGAKRPDYKKKYSKHVTTNGFNQTNVNECVNKFMSRAPKGDRRIHQNSFRIAFTDVIQKWTLDGSTSKVEIFHLAPWGMKEAIAKRLSLPQVKGNFSGLPLLVKETFGITSDTFDKGKITVEVENTGYNAPQPSVRFYCKDCQKIFLPKLLNNPKDGNFESLEALI